MSTGLWAYIPARSAFVKINKSLFVGLFGPLAVSALLDSSLAAGKVSVELPYANFIQMGAVQPLANSGPKCASTATINSFVYLYNTFPAIYGGTSLLTGSNPGNSLSDARDELDGPGFMNNGGCGVLPQNFWEGKLKWIDAYAPNTTVFDGMSVFPFAGWYGEQYLEAGYPSFEFLFGQLRDKEDVELGIFYPAGGHAITLTSLHFMDANMDGDWDPAGESASIDYIDPNCPSGTLGQPQGPREVPLYYDPLSGSLQFDWVNGDGVACDPSGPKNRATIKYAFAESPVPAPLPILGLATALGSVRRLKTFSKQLKSYSMG